MFLPQFCRKISTALIITYFIHTSCTQYRCICINFVAISGKIVEWKLLEVSTWMGDRLVGCTSVVKRPYSSMSLKLEEDS